MLRYPPTLFHILFHCWMPRLFKERIKSYCMVGKVRFELTKRTSSFTHGFTTRSLDHLDTFQYIWWAERELNSLGLNKVSVLQTEVPTLTHYPPRLLTYQVFISLKSLVIFCWLCSQRNLFCSGNIFYWNQPHIQIFINTE